MVDKSKKCLFEKVVSWFYLYFFSITISSLIIQIIGTFFWIIESKNHEFDINDFLQTLYNTVYVCGLTSGFTTLFIFIIGIIFIMLHRLIRLFEDN